MSKQEIKWKYTRQECRERAGECYDCGLPYPEGNDCTVPDDVWEKINPTAYKGAGLLCANCIMHRLDFLRIRGVKATLW